MQASAQSISSIPQDDGFFPANMRWTGATAKGYDANIALKAVGGNVALCGVGIVTNIQLNSAINSGLRGGRVKVNGKTILKDFSFFAKAPNIKSLDKVKANCKLTSVTAIRKSDKVSIRYGKATFRN